MPVLFGQSDCLVAQTGQEPGQRPDVLLVEITIEAFARNVKSSALPWSPPLVNQLVLLLLKSKKEGCLTTPLSRTFLFFLALAGNS
jgi:hypothetical protein